ncbi:MAG: hypothetical protein IPM57_00770 [Oligoflexia bacterium]|nr:hypothetical protein [Oligoflexia bacterium]
MDIKTINPPRIFEVGFEHKIKMSDCAKIKLNTNEQVTFLTDTNGEYDVAKKDWGFYATPSLNGRLAQFKLRPALVKNGENRFFILLVEQGKENLFYSYIEVENMQIVSWLDTTESLLKLEESLKNEK